MYREHPDLAPLRPEEVDDTDATALPTPSNAPTQFAHAARPWDDIAGLGLDDESFLKLGVLLIGQVFLNEAREQHCLDEADHAP